MTSTMTRWTIFIPTAYILLVCYFRWNHIGDSVTRGGSRLSDVMSYLIVSEICVVYLAVVGTMGFFQMYSGWDYGNIFEDNLFGRSPFVEEYLSSPMLAYQVWTLVFALLYKEFRTVDFLVHHIVTIAITASTFLPIIQYFFLLSGLAEITNVVLGVYDSFQYLGDVYKTKYASIYKLVQYSFGTLFIAIRIVYWTYVAIPFFRRLMKVFMTADDGQFFIGLIFVSCYALTILQYYWAILIVKKFFIKNKKIN